MLVLLSLVEVNLSVAAGCAPLSVLAPLKRAVADLNIEILDMKYLYQSIYKFLSFLCSYILHC